MKKSIITGLTLSLISCMSFADKPSKQTKNDDQANKVIADFESDSTSLKWRSINDGVMGGRSQGSSYITEASH